MLVHKYLRKVKNSNIPSHYSQVVDKLVVTKTTITVMHNDALHDNRMATFKFKNKRQVQSIINQLQRIVK